MHDLLELSAASLVNMLRTKKVSSRELLQAHLQRIQDVNREVNAVVTLGGEEELFAAAHRADEQLAKDLSVGLLHGLPMTHKDTHRVKGMRTTQGSLIYQNHVPEEDDLIIRRLRHAGVISTGKTNVPEFAAGSHTFNEVFGTTRNPYALDRSAGGSSGGLAAALAARIQPLGDGSDMGGSLRIPASFCNVVGFRPSYGIIPTPSSANVWQWLARTGPMARTVEDIALFMSAVSGPAPELPLSAAVLPSAFHGLTEDSLNGVRIGWSPDFGVGLPIERQVLEVLEKELTKFEELGAVVEEAAIDFSEADTVFGRTRAMNFAEQLGDVVRNHRALIKPEVVWNVELGWAMTVQDMIHTHAAAARLLGHVRSFFSKYDLFVSPGAQLAPFDVNLRYPDKVAGIVTNTYLDWMRSSSMLSATSLPVLSIPAGFTPDGLPVGFQLAANHYEDSQLLRWGKAFENYSQYATRRPNLLDPL